MWVLDSNWLKTMLLMLHDAMQHCTTQSQRMKQPLGTLSWVSTNFSNVVYKADYLTVLLLLLYCMKMYFVSLFRSLLTHYILYLDKYTYVLNWKTSKLSVTNVFLHYFHSIGLPILFNYQSISFYYPYGITTPDFDFMNVKWLWTELNHHSST